MRPLFIVDSNDLSFVRFFIDQYKNEMCLRAWCKDMCKCNLFSVNKPHFSTTENQLAITKSNINILCFSPLSLCTQVLPHQEAIIKNCIVILFLDMRHPCDKIFENVVKKKIYNRLIIVTISDQKDELDIADMITGSVCRFELTKNNSLNFELIAMYVAKIVTFYNTELSQGKPFKCRREKTDLYEPFDQLAMKLDKNKRNCECFKFD